MRRRSAIPFIVMLLGLSSGPVAIALNDLLQIFFAQIRVDWATMLVLGLILTFAVYVRIQYCPTRLNVIFANVAIAGAGVWLLGLFALLHFLVVS